MMEKCDTDKLSFEEGNPGAVLFGNFINYYQFHPPENRIKLLPQITEIVQELEDDNKNEILALDLGCNAGDLTLALYDKFNEHWKSQVNFLGIDIDPILIQRATEQIDGRNIEFKTLDFMNKELKESIVCKYLNRGIRNQFDIIFCFSLTMWIHLNHGDEGLKNFLIDLTKLTKLLIIEPQPWKCYRSATKRVKTMQFPHFKTLKIRQNVEDAIHTTISSKMTQIFKSPDSEWGRKILIYKKL